MPHVSQKVFDRFWHLVTAVGQQTMIAHADTQAAGNPVKDNSGDYGGPAPEKKRCNGSKMRDNEENPRTPIPFGPIDLELLTHGRVSAFFFQVHITNLPGCRGARVHAADACN